MICYEFFKFTAKPWKTCKHTLEREKTNYNRVLRRSSPPLHLAGGVLLGRAYRGSNGEAREREEVEVHLPRSAFECKVTGSKLVGVKGGG